MSCRRDKEPQEVKSLHVSSANKRASSTCPCLPEACKETLP